MRATYIYKKVIVVDECVHSNVLSEITIGAQDCTVRSTCICLYMCHVNYNNTHIFYCLIESILQMHNFEEGNFNYNFVNKSNG